MRTTRTWRNSLSLILVPATLWACQAAPIGVPPGTAFQIAPGTESGSAAASGAPAAAVPIGLNGRPADSGSPAAPAPAPAGRPSIPLTITPTAASAGRSASTGGGSSAGSVAPATTGSVTIDVGRALLAALPARRRLLATTADIDHVVVILRMPNQADRMQFVSQAQVAAGATTVTFSGLPAGTATLVVTAFDAIGTALGTGTQSAAVAVGQTTALALDVAIDPGVVANAAGGGAVEVAISFSNGTAATAASTCPTPAGTVVATWTMPAWGLYADGRGKVYSYYWEGEPIGSPTTHGVVLIHTASTADGTAGDPYPIGGWSHPTAFARFVHTAGGLVFAPGSGTLWYPGAGEPPDPNVLPTEGTEPCTVLDAAGDAVFPSVALVPDPLDPNASRPVHRIVKRTAAGASTITAMAAYRAVAYDAAGNLWADWTDDGVNPPPDKQSLQKYAPDGSLLATVPLPVIPLKIEADAAGNIWVSGSTAPGGSTPLPGDTLLKLSPDGSVLATITGPVLDFAIDGNQSLWVATGTAVRKHAQDGTLVGQTAFAATQITFGAGMVYAGNATSLLGSGMANTVVAIAP